MFDIILESFKDDVGSIDPNLPDKDGIIENIEKAFDDDPVAKKVAYMLANSHEYANKPNTLGAIQFVKNYKWKESTCKLNKLQGIDKPKNNAKVLEIANSMKDKPEIDTECPLIVVNKISNITNQTPGCKILWDGMHRAEAKKFLGHKFAATYDGKYTGGSHKDMEELINESADDIPPQKTNNPQSNSDTQFSIIPHKKRVLKDHNHTKTFSKPVDDSELQPPVVTEGFDMFAMPDRMKNPKKRKIGQKEKFELTPDERKGVRSKYGNVQCSFFRDKDGYFCMTHRCRSKSYPTPTSIPVKDVEFVSSTS